MIHNWIAAARLRTLPLSLSGIILAAGIAMSQGNTRYDLMAIALLTTLFFQVLSNFANDLGDGEKGTDNHKVGEQRTVATGAISNKQMRIAVYTMAGISATAAIGLIYLAFGIEKFWYSIVFLLLATASIWAAIKYTMGGSAYGYRAMGDVFVYLFFGHLAVMGGYFVFTQSWTPLLLFPAHFIGAMSVAVLNLNNMRDRETDRLAGKTTIANSLGKTKSTYYHFILLHTAFFALFLFLSSWNHVMYDLFALAPFLGLLPHVWLVKNHTRPIQLDGELKKVALTTFIITILTTLLINI